MGLSRRSSNISGNYWESEVYKCCKNWLQDFSFPAELNDTNIVLIMKKENGGENGGPASNNSMQRVIQDSCESSWQIG